MKERHDSEKKLKNAFDNYQMPFDNAAFEKFSEALDKEEKRRKFIWWLLYGKIIIPIVVVGLIVLAVLYNPFSNENKQLSSANIETTHSETNINSKISDNDKIESNNSNQLTSADTKTNTNTSSQLSSALTNKSVTTKVDTNTSGAQNNVVQNSMISPSTGNNNSDQTSSNDTPENSVIENEILSGTLSNDRQEGNLNYGNNNAENSDSRSLKQYSTPQISGEVDNENSIDLDKGNETLRLEITGINLLNLLQPELLKRQEEAKYVTIDKDVIPYKAPFKKYFYFNVGGGVTIENNHGPFNELFKVRKTNELLWRISAAYQVNPTTSFDLSYMQKNVSIGFEMKDFIYRERYAKKISMVKLGMSNRLWQINRNIRLNMSHGVSLILAPSHINDFADSKNTYQATPFPDGISNIDSEWMGTYEGTNLLLSSGLNVDVRLSKRLELNIGAEYTHGTKSIMSADLNYIEGEGIRRKLQALTNSSFVSFNVGLKYSLKTK